MNEEKLMKIIARLEGKRITPAYAGKSCTYLAYQHI